MKNPFDIPEPLLIGMSGGQTSAYQLHRFLEYLGGKIEGRRAVVFANTGDEDERTLKFVERVSLEWDVSITWLEYRFESFPQELLDDPEFRSLRQRQFANRKDKGLREELALRMKDAGFLQQAVSIAMGRETLNGRSTYALVNYADGQPKQRTLFCHAGMPRSIPAIRQRTIRNSAQRRTAYLHGRVKGEADAPLCV